ncbi:MAG: SdpI family protein [Lachnospiraceae bacterium]|nr:SdpI family protein [Lachnospiraceae bacterium]
MKKLYKILFIIWLICVAGTVVFLILSPDRIPAHYNFSGEVDRFGSKYENLIWPLFAILLGLFFVLMARRARRAEESANEKILMITGVFTLAFFTLLGFFFMIKALRYDPSAAPKMSYDDVNRFVNIGLGVLLVVMGNFMPKARKNAVFGIRTSWSLSSDSVWQKSQRFGGIVTVIGGLVLIILSLFVPGLWNLLVLAVVLTVMIILCTAASRRYYREEKAKGTA